MPKSRIYDFEIKKKLTPEISGQELTIVLHFYEKANKHMITNGAKG